MKNIRTGFEIPSCVFVGVQNFELLLHSATPAGEGEKGEGENDNHDNWGNSGEQILFSWLELAEKERISHDGNGGECHGKSGKFWF